MKIECKLQREGGSIVTLGSEEYHFQPDEYGRHVAEVDNDEHIERLLEIPEYRPLEGEEPPNVEPATSGSTLEPEGGEEPTVEPETEAEKDELETARDEYEAYFGKRPHHAMKAETIRARIEAGEA